MANLNKVQIIGRLGRDPESKTLPNGDAVTNFSIAISEKWNDKNTGEKREQTEWVNVVAFRKLGEIAAKYLRKGSSIYVEGKLKTRKWQDKNGNDRYTTEVVADAFQMLGGKRDEQASQDNSHDQGDAVDDDIPF